MQALSRRIHTEPHTLVTNTSRPPSMEDGSIDDGRDTETDEETFLYSTYTPNGVAGDRSGVTVPSLRRLLGNVGASLNPPPSLPPFFLLLLFHPHSAATLATLATPCLPCALSPSSPAFSPSASFIRVSFSSVYTPLPTPAPLSSVHVHVCAM